MTIHANSLATYFTLRDANQLAPKEMEVVAALVEHGPLTRQQIPEITGMPINCVSGRVKSLLDKGLIEPVGTVMNPITRKPNELLRLAARQMELAGVV